MAVYTMQYFLPGETRVLYCCKTQESLEINVLQWLTTSKLGGVVFVLFFLFFYSGILLTVALKLY